MSTLHYTDIRHKDDVLKKLVGSSLGSQAVQRLTNPPSPAIPAAAITARPSPVPSLQGFILPPLRPPTSVRFGHMSHHRLRYPPSCHLVLWRAPRPISATVTQRTMLPRRLAGSESTSYSVSCISVCTHGPGSTHR